jgi:hypothetical protein
MKQRQRDHKNSFRGRIRDGDIQDPDLPKKPDPPISADQAGRFLMILDRYETKLHTAIYYAQKHSL